jgi:hypothetical protein
VDLVAPRRAPRQRERSDFPRGSRVSGVIIVIVAAHSLLLLVRHSGWLEPAFRAWLLLGSALGLVVGVLLVRGRPRARPVALVLLGFALLCALIGAPHPGTAAYGALTVFGHALLLLGDPGWVVIGLGVLLATPGLLLNVFLAFS